MGKLRNHLLFWVLYIAFVVAIYYVKEPSLALHLLYEMASLPAKLLAVYSIIYWILPKYILGHQYLKAGIGLLIIMVVAVVMLHVSVSLTVYPVFFPVESTNITLSQPGKLISLFLDLLVVCSVAVVVKLIRDRELSDRRRLEREKTILDNELKLLKSQLHPHFLFNTLNGLYNCTLQEPELASKIVLMLSDLLRYIIYEGNKALVALSEDIQALKNYLELEKLRHGKNLTSTFTIKGNISNQPIPPLLLLPFVENAFKHKRSGGNRNIIEGKIVVDDHSLKFQLSNTTDIIHETAKNGGIGLLNVRQRLEHYYGKEYRLDISNNDGLYRVEINLPIHKV